MRGRTLKIDKLPSVRRLPTYLRFLRVFSSQGHEYVTSGLLADQLGVESILVRKDLELTGISGTPRIGYYVAELITSIENYLGWGETMDMFLVGVGKMGTALLGYQELESHGHRIIASFDRDPAKINRSVYGVPVFHVSKAADLLVRMNIRLAILTVPDEEAQTVADMLVGAGVQGIWNFTSVPLAVPHGVITQKEELLSGLAVLSIKIASRAGRENGGDR